MVIINKDVVQGSKGNSKNLKAIRIFAGYYRRYDNKTIYVISTATDADTGEATVIWTDAYSSETRYYTTTKASFCEDVVVSGESMPKFRRIVRRKVSEGMIEDIGRDGFRGPVRRKKRCPPDEYDTRYYQMSETYYEYAKTLCENYNFDRHKHNLCVKEKRYIAITKTDFEKLKEDLSFLNNSLKTVLIAYRDFFRERYIQGASIRKYAAAHNMNRGSVEYLQKKFLTALAQLLKERDEADGKTRLRSHIGL